jgi:hypothetical protein
LSGVKHFSGQRQLEFPMFFERYQQQSGLWEKWESRGLCGISKGGGKGGKPAFGFPRFPPPGFFHSPSGSARFYRLHAFDPAVPRFSWSCFFVVASIT